MTNGSEMGNGRAWWKEAVFYQIYPRSFNDSNGDGIGDIPGITAKVDYLDALGVDAVWLCPVYDSPMEDNGYDIREYRSIHDEFGDMSDWEQLLSELHARDMRLIMDLVVNHTSVEHEWFQQSRRREGKYEDYYYWRDGDPEEPPNNWDSIFGGSAWTYDDERGQWYLHLFDETQPDLNWRNPAVRESMKDVTRWWLEKGIDGFRLDAITYLSKVDGLPDGDPQNTLVGAEHFTHGPRLEAYLTELCKIFEAYDAVSVAEMAGTTIDQAAHYAGVDGPGIDLPFQFDHVHAGYDPGSVFDPDVSTEWDFETFRDVIVEQQRTIPWNALFFSNHDLPRLVSRIGDDESYRRESATLLATCLLTLRGTPFVYQGDEIGMTNAEFETLEEVDDPMSVGQIRALVADGTLENREAGMEIVNEWSRDHSRTPMQWSADEEAGFTDGKPWLTVTENDETITVEAARANDRSIWHYYRELIDLRHGEDVLVYGDFELLLPEDQQVFAYRRSLGDDQILVFLNFSGVSLERSLPAHSGLTDDPDLLLSNYGDVEGRAPLTLRPWEARLYRLSSD